MRSRWQTALSKHQSHLITWLPFLLVWIWAIRFNPLTHIPAYGDTLEVIWGANWYSEMIRHKGNPLFYSGVFYPSGWPTALLAHTPIMLLLMGLIGLILPPAAVYNAFVLASFVVTYVGMIRLVRLYIDKHWIVVLAALLYTFWGMRWVRLGGHLNILWVSALLPWLIWILQSSVSERRKVLLSALIWTLCITASLYGIWIGAVVVAVYFLNEPRTKTLRQIVLIVGLTLIFSLPTLLPFWLARQATASPFFGLEHISGWGASINSLPIPALFHPWLRNIVQLIYPGPFDESGIANMGLVAVAVALVSLAFVRIKDARQRFAVLILIVGLVLALGPVLRWSGELLEIPLFAPVNRTLWQIGSRLKPDIFVASIPPALEVAVPLPAWLLYATVPFLEGSRVASRFAFVAGIGLLLLVAQVLERIKVRWLLAALAFLLLFERAPWPIERGFPLPVMPHPAFEWLSDQAGKKDDAVLDLILSDNRFSLAISGETLYATDLHKKSTASGVSTMWPNSTWFLVNWLQGKERPLQNPELAAVLDGYGINWVLVHIKDDQRKGFAVDADLNGLQLIDCFGPDDGPSAWPYSICVLEVQQEEPLFQVQPIGGWSPEEPWGRWAMGKESAARWIVPVVQNYELHIDAFPHCVEGQQQTLNIKINDQDVNEVFFDECNPYSGRIQIAAEYLEEGWNELDLEFAYAITPAELTSGQNPDPRKLSVGITHLELIPK